VGLLVLNEEAVVTCKHVLGVVSIEPTQNLVFIQGKRVLVEPNPEARPISHCPNYGITIKPCTFTLKVDGGYSSLIRIKGKRVCLQAVTGLTDGTPPGIVKFEVQNSGQQLVWEDQ
jgi:hypothetical protein